MADEIIKARIVFDKGGLGATPGQSGGSSSGGGLAGGAGTGLFSGKMLKTLGVIGATLFVISKSLKALEKASPRLNATMNIFKKSMEMTLRPFGDIMSVYLRPLSIMMLRWGIKFYKAALPFIKKEKEDQENMTGMEYLRDRAYPEWLTKVTEPIREFTSNILFNGEWWSEQWSKVKEWSAGTIFEGQWWTTEWNKVKEWSIGTIFDGDWWSSKWGSIATWFTNAWEEIPSALSEGVIEPIKELWQSVEEWFEGGVTQPIKDMWESITNWFEDSMITPIKDMWESIPTWFTDNIITPIKDAWESITNWFEEGIIGPIKDSWESITNWFQSSIIDPIKEGFKGVVNFLVDLLNDVFPFLNLRGYATGGYIPQDGMYKLHAGETIVPAHMQGVNNNNSYAPNITIQATINNETDLNELASKLSKLTTQGIQRRVSYTF